PIKPTPTIPILTIAVFPLLFARYGLHRFHGLPVFHRFSEFLAHFSTILSWTSRTDRTPGLWGLVRLNRAARAPGWQTPQGGPSLVDEKATARPASKRRNKGGRRTPFNFQGRSHRRPVHKMSVNQTHPWLVQGVGNP